MFIIRKEKSQDISGKKYDSHFLATFYLIWKLKESTTSFKTLTVKAFLFLDWGLSDCSHQTKCGLPPHFPKGPSIGQNDFYKIVSGNFFNYYKPLKTTINYYKLV
jgi:hypothetical protein